MKTPSLPLPACRSTAPEGCAQCSSAFACHDARLGRSHMPWAIIGLAFLLLAGLAF